MRKDIRRYYEFQKALVTVQTKDKSNVDELREVCFSPGDVLVLQANNDSLLLERPPSDFYKSETKGPKNSSSEGSVDNSLEQTSNSDGIMSGIMSSASKSHVWNDLRILFNEKEGQDNEGDESREFLAAVKVSAKSKHIDKTVEEAGLDSQVGLFLVSVERPVVPGNMHMTSFLFIHLSPVVAQSAFPIPCPCYQCPQRVISKRMTSFGSLEMQRQSPT